jgi:ankyrin repeat protein
MERIEEFCKAAAKGDLGTCRSCFAVDPGLIHSTYEEMQPIHWAAQQNQAQVVKYLIDNGADVNAVGGDRSWTPLYYSVSLAPNAAKVLIESGCDLDLEDSEGYSPLALAISEQTLPSEQVVKMLRDAGAPYGLTEAAAMGDLERVKDILTQDQDSIANVPSKQLVLNLLLGVGNYGTLEDREEILKLLFKHGLKVESEELLKQAESCEISNIGNFGTLLRQYAAGN